VKKIIFFSHNDNKIKEVIKLFKETRINILTLHDFPNISKPKEIGSTFEENAEIKSSYGYKKIKLPCFADDSGICIDALGGFPGIKSKRFLKKNDDYKKTFKTIINKAKKLSNFQAYFQTSISLTFDSETFFFKGIVRGKISSEPRGEYGFDYDPIFIPKGSKKTFGEMSIKEKNKISHRARAINKLKKFLIKSLN
jgi:XTP/dITP diphosphohydrolase|tara:strand:- start:568 stop:1155 length:588 start_codon:yes stop_codon:yes gene_type:complete